MYFPMPSQIANHDEFAATAFDIAGKRLFASVTVHVRLQ
jgi:hypothetical protein